MTAADDRWADQAEGGKSGGHHSFESFLFSASCVEAGELSVQGGAEESASGSTQKSGHCVDWQAEGPIEIRVGRLPSRGNGLWERAVPFPIRAPTLVSESRVFPARLSCFPAVCSDDT